MLNRAPLFLALRYLRPKRSFVSVITIISILGVMVGVLMMVVVRSVMVGFEVEFRETLIGSEPHALLTPESKTSSAKDWPPVLAEVRSDPAVVAAAPVAGGVLYVAKGDAQTGMQVMGLAPRDSQPFLAKIHKHLLAGNLDLPDGTLILSDYMANEIEANIGDEVSAYPSQNVNEMVRKYRAASDEDDSEKKKAAYRQIKLYPRKLIVAGILRSETAGFAGYVSLKTGQDLFALGQGVSGIAVELKEPNHADEFAAKLKARLRGWKVELWSDSNQARLAAMSNEQFVMLLVLCTIALVAAFSVMNTTITVTTQKRREIGVMTALGAGRGTIVRIFLYQAGIVGFIGTAAGLAASLLILKYRNEIRESLAFLTGGQVHAVEGVFLSSIPAYIQPLMIALVCGFSLVLCIFAGWLPAWVAARVDPAVALRD